MSGSGSSADPGIYCGLWTSPGAKHRISVVSKSDENLRGELGKSVELNHCRSCREIPMKAWRFEHHPQVSNCRLDPREALALDPEPKDYREIGEDIKLTSSRTDPIVDEVEM